MVAYADDLSEMRQSAAMAALAAMFIQNQGQPIPQHSHYTSASALGSTSLGTTQLGSTSLGTTQDWSTFAEQAKIYRNNRIDKFFRINKSCRLEEGDKFEEPLDELRIETARWLN